MREKNNSFQSIFLLIVGSQALGSKMMFYMDALGSWWDCVVVGFDAKSIVIAVQGVEVKVAKDQQQTHLKKPAYVITREHGNLFGHYYMKP